MSKGTYGKILVTGEMKEIKTRYSDRELVDMGNEIADAVSAVMGCIATSYKLGLNTGQRTTLYDHDAIDRTLQFLDGGGELRLTTLDGRRFTFTEILESLQEDISYVDEVLQKGEKFEVLQYFHKNLPRVREIGDKLAGEETMIKSIIAPEVNR